MNHDIPELDAEAFSLVPEHVEDAPSSPIDLSDLIDEIERGEGSESKPPTLVDRPSLLWGLSSGLHSSLLSTAVPTQTAEGWQALVEELAAESQAAEDPAVRAALMCEAGRILLDRLGRQEEGLLLVRNSGSTAAKVLLDLRSGASEGLADELTQLEREGKEASLDPARRAAAWIEFGLACEEIGGSRTRALVAYRAALTLVPDHPVALALASDAAILEGDFAFGREINERRITTSSVPKLQSSWLLDLAECVDDPATRRSLLERATSLDPLEETALRRLIRVVAAANEPSTLGKLYLRRADIATDPISRATALHLAFLTLAEAGEPLEDVVQDLLRTEAEATDPTDLLAPMSEVALYMERRFAAKNPFTLGENVALLERIVRSLDAPREQALVREQLARIRSGRLHELRKTSPDPQDSMTGLPKLSDDRLELCRALEADLRFCLAHLPEHRWVFSALADLLEYRGDVPGLVLHLQEWSRMQPAGSGRATILLELGRVHEELRRDLPRAAEVYELAVAESPENVDCLRALGRIYEKMRRWGPAIAALQRQARGSDDAPERLVALRKVAEIAEREIGDVDLAIATREVIAEEDPDDILSLYQLAALCRTHARLPVLVRTLQQLVDRVNDDVSRTNLLVELGEVLELHLRQRVHAREAYERALQLSPGYTPALRALARLYRDNGDAEALVRLHDPAIDPVTDPAILALKVARVRLEEMGNLEGAIDDLRRAYRLDPDLVPARELLLQLLTANGHIREAYDLLRAQDPPQSPALAADTHYRLGLLAEALARQATSTDPALADAALQHHRAALVAQPDHGLAWERARRLLVASSDVPNLIRAYEQQLDLASGDAKASVLVTLARLQSNIGGDGITIARRAYEDAVELSPGDPLVRREYEGLLRRLDDTRSLPSVLLVGARATEDKHLRATLLVEAAETLLASDRPEDRELAANSVLEALRDDPGNPYAVRHLERLLADADPPVAMTEAVGARAVRAQSDAERALFYFESAELLERGGAYDQARRAYQAALQAMPGLVAAELGLVRVSAPQPGTAPVRAASGARPAAESLHVLMAEAREAAVRSGTTGRAADALVAIDRLAQVLGRDADMRDAHALLRALTGQLADPSPALELFRTLLPNVRDPELRYEVALLLGEHAARLEDSAKYLEVAVSARPDGKQALRALVHCFRQMGRDADAAEATEHLLGLYEPGEASAIELRMGVARFLGRNAETMSRALDHARIALQARPDDPRTITLMAELLERNGQRIDAARLLERLATRERDRTKLHEILLRQARLLATSGDHQADAINAAEKAAELSPGHRDTIRLLVTLLEQNKAIERITGFVPAIRSAMQANIVRGAVSVRDLRLLSSVERPIQPRLADFTDLVCHAIDPSSVPPPDDHLKPASPHGLAALLSEEVRPRLLGNESLALHEILQAIDPVLPRLAADFPLASDADVVPLPHNADAQSFTALLQNWSRVCGVDVPSVVACNTHNAAALLAGRPPSLHVGTNLWMHGEPSAWRGLAAVALARHAFGAPIARALNPMEMDLVIAAAFELVGVFNAITADPDPRRLRELVAALGKLLPRRNRRVLERACQALAGSDIVPSMSARATLAADLRLAFVVTADVAGVLSACALLDGAAGGSLKQRIVRSRSAQAHLAWMLSDDVPELRRIATS